MKAAKVQPWALRRSAASLREVENGFPMERDRKKSCLPTRDAQFSKPMTNTATARESVRQRGVKLLTSHESSHCADAS